MSALRAMDLLRVAWRLAFLQVTWCEGGMQSEGLGFCLIPGLRRLHREPARLDEALRRYRAPFNTHPFLAGVVAGIALNVEESGADQKRVASFMRGTMGSLGAVGDPFFHFALAPAAAIFACVAGYLAGPLAAIVTLLALFNLLHLAIRIAGVFTGYRRGEEALVRVTAWMGASRSCALKAAAAAASGVLIGVLALEGAREDGLAWASLLGVFVVAGALFLVKKRSLWVYFAPAALAVLFLLEAVL